MMNPARKRKGTARYVASLQVRVDQVNPNVIHVVGSGEVSGEAEPASGIEASNSQMKAEVRVM